MKLTDLEPEFLRYDAADQDGTHTSYRRVGSIEEANGLQFVCPKCLTANGYERAGVHSVHCWCVGVPLDVGLVGPGRWILVGTGFADLTLNAPNSRSVQIIGGCAWHGFITNGDVTDA